MVSENCFTVSEKKRFSFIPVGGNPAVLASRVALLWIDEYVKGCPVRQLSNFSGLVNSFLVTE